MLLVIQGTADTEQTDQAIQERAATSVDFALSVIHESTPEEQKALIEKIQKAAHEPEELEKLTPDELAVLVNLREKQLRFIKGEKDLANFSHDAIEGFTPRLETGSLGLQRTKSETMNGHSTNGHGMNDPSMNGNGIKDKEPMFVEMLEVADPV